MARNAFIDHLRITLTALVILHHTAIVYGGSGGWYWRQEADASNRALLFFNAVNQSFFMGFFFLLAGYFTPNSYAKKGAGPFLAERFLRLGLPLLGYFFIISPLTIALARTSEGHPFWSGWGLMIQLGEFEPGPLWFAEALLIFAVAYTVWRKWRPETTVVKEGMPRFPELMLAAISVAAISFFVRLKIPVGTNVAWLQIGYFPAYVLLFIAGCRAARTQLLERITLADAKPWAFISAVMLVLLPILIVTRGDQGAFTGGWTLNAAFYALWDPLIAWGIILMLLWSFSTYWSKESGFTSALARRAYGAYILHPPVLVGLSLLCREWTMAPWLKFGAVGLLACAGAFGAASVLLLIPGVRKVV